jgi:hypothetical protein
MQRQPSPQHSQGHLPLVVVVVVVVPMASPAPNCIMQPQGASFCMRVACSEVEAEAIFFVLVVVIFWWLLMEVAVDVDVYMYM